MSEYQYYEFLAIDRPLSAKDMEELRALSTRAQITTVSFINEYHFGNFKGNPDTLMKRYFDAHVYLANWGHCHLSLRVPRDALDVKIAAAYGTENALVIKEAGKHWLIDWSLSESESDRFGGEDDGRGWMSRLTPLRDELLRGDWRGLYIGWLAAVTAGELEEDEREPPLPAGMKQPTAAQRALVEFLEVDPDLLVGAVLASADADQPPEPDETEAWLDTLPPEEVRERLRQLLAGQGLQAERALNARFAAWLRAQHPTAVEPNRRTVAELQQLAEEARQHRLRKKTAARARAEAERRKLRQSALRKLAQNFNRAWEVADRQAAQGTATGYDEALRSLVDLADAYELCATRAQFEAALQRFMAPHTRRTALVRRLVEAGLWKKS
jgi:hypothetical protein